jgi:hypothetical protein
MKYTAILIMALLGCALTQSTIPQNYCDSKLKARCGSCVFDADTYYSSCIDCGRNGFATLVEGQEKVKTCAKLQRFNAWCEYPLSTETCELCYDGGYWDKATQTCAQYMEEKKVENCWEHSGDIAGLCSTCKGGLAPSEDHKTCGPAPTGFENCELIGLEWGNPDATYVCYTCKEKFYKDNSKAVLTDGSIMKDMCTGVAKEGIHEGCLEGTAELCTRCHTIGNYTMNTPTGKCVLSSGILSSLVIMLAMTSAFFF